LKDNITYKYTTVSDSERSKFVENIASVNTNYNSINDTIATKISQLNTKYSTNLESYKSSLKSAFDANKSAIDLVKSFDTNFNELFTLETDFQKNYEIFKKAYLSYA
jgi:hypothetical protein